MYQPSSDLRRITMSRYTSRPIIGRELEGRDMRGEARVRVLSVGHHSCYQGNELTVLFELRTGLLVANQISEVC